VLVALRGGSHLCDAAMTKPVFREFVPNCCIATKKTCKVERRPYNLNHAALQHKQAIRAGYGAVGDFLPQPLEK
jgi:hypothetical protein